MKKYLAFFLMHCLFSGMLFSMAYVYQKSYNKTNREQIRMAGVVMQNQQADVQILHCHFPVAVPAEDSLFWYGAYLVTDTVCHDWSAILEFIKNS